MQKSTPDNTSQNNEAEIDLLALFGALIDRKWTIIICAAIALMIGAVYATLSTPVYVANAVIQVEKKANGIGGAMPIDFRGFGSDTSAQTEIELLKSRYVVGKAVDSLKLDAVATPRFFPLIGRYLYRRNGGNSGNIKPAFLGMSSYAWGGERIDLFQFTVPEAMQGRRFDLIALDQGRYELVHGETSILQGEVGKPASAEGISIQIAELKARPGTRFTVRQSPRLPTVLTYQARLQVEQKGMNTGILQLRMRDPDPAHAVSVLNEISRLYVLQNVERKSAEAQQSLDFVRAQLPTVRKELERAEGELNSYRASASSVDISIETSALLEQSVSLETQISQLNLQKAELEKRFTREHPSYQALMDQIRQVENQRATLASKIGDLPETQQEMLRMARDVQVSTEIYTQMLNKAQELDIMRAGTVANVRIIDDAAANLRPVSPRKGLILLASLVLGTLIGLGIALLKYMLNRGIETPDVIEKLGLPVYASIPFSKDQGLVERALHGKKNGHAPHNLLAVSNPADLAIEALRSLRTSLHFAMLEAKNNILMVSGPSPGVGKSFVSANLAAIIAQSGKKVVIVDADMRKGYLHKLMSKQPDPGLSSLLVNTHTLADVIHTTDVEGLHVITRGQVPPNPSELLMHANFAALLDKLSKVFDLVIVDTPPILAVTDAALVGRLAGTSLIVTRFGLNAPKEIELTLQRFRNNGIEIKGAIFNAVEKKASAYGYYGNYAYYQYEYKSDKK